LPLKNSSGDCENIFSAYKKIIGYAIGRRAEMNEDIYAVETYRQVGELLGECLNEKFQLQMLSLTY
jgi:hypothetical protein